MKALTVKAYISSEDKISSSNKLLICQNFGFIYDYIEPISEVGKGSINIIFDILYRHDSITPYVLIPRKEFKKLFIEFEAWLHFREICKNDYGVIKEEGYMIIPDKDVKVLLPENSLIFKTSNDNVINSFLKVLNSFWSWDCYLTEHERVDTKVGYSGTKDLFMGKQNGKY